MHVSPPSLSLHKSGSFYFLALLLWGKECHTVLRVIMEKKIYCPLAIAISIAAIRVGGGVCLWFPGGMHCQQ